MKNEILKLDHVSKKIKKKEIVKEISFSIKEGEVLGFLGPNGAGKSTTLRMIVGLSTPTSGEITICGHSIKHEYVKAMEQVGCMIEGPDLYNYMTGQENLSILAAMNKDIKKDDILEAVRIVSMEEHLNEKVGTYSLGMKQRMGLAQALMMHPKLIILDEPTNGLDPAGINEFRILIRKLADEENIAVLVSSHLMSEIELMCDNVSIIKSGQIIKNSSVEELLNSKEIFWVLDDPVKGNKILMETFQIPSKINGIKLEAEVNSTQISKINDTFIKEGLELQLVDYKHKTLEDLFLDLTKD